MTYQPLTWSLDDFVFRCWGIDRDGYSDVVFSASNKPEKLHLIKLIVNVSRSPAARNDG